MAIATTVGTTILAPRFGPRPLVTAGMLLAAGGMVLLTRLGLDSTYAADVLPGLLLVGVGLGLVIAPAMSTATLGVGTDDAGVASAMVNTMQQVGGSIGTALLSTLAVGAVTATARRQRRRAPRRSRPPRSTATPPPSAGPPRSSPPAPSSAACSCAPAPRSSTPPRSPFWPTDST